MVSVPLALDNVRSVNDLGLLMFIGEADRTTSELSEFYGAAGHTDGRILKRIKSFETNHLITSRRVEHGRGHRGFFWSLTDAGRSALRQLADNITASISERELP